MSEQIPFTVQIRNAANTTLDVILNGMVSATSAAQNTATQAQSTATSAYVQANGAFNAANTASSSAAAAQTTANQGVTAAANAQTQANAGRSQANSAYAAANSGISIAQAAYGQANSASAAAATAQSTANQGVAASGVSPGSYGSSISSPAFTVDARGRIIGVTDTTIRTFTTGLSGVVPASGSDGNILFGNGWGTLATLGITYSATQNGYIQLPGGIYLIWGITNTGALSGETTYGPYNFWKAFPTNCWNCQIQGNGGAPLGVSGTTKTNYNVATGYTGGPTTNLIYYWAIGN